MGCGPWCSRAELDRTDARAFGFKTAILMYAGKDATNEFLLLHKPQILDKYGKDMKVGKVEG